MPIASADILYKLSVATGSAGNSTGGTPGAALGKYVSTTVITDAALENIFPNVSGDENAASNVDYQCIFVHNNHATLTLQDTKAWLVSDVAGGATVAIGVDPTAASAKTSSSAQAVQVADKDTAPAGVAFSAPTTKPAGLALGDIGPGQVKALWVRRTATNSGALNNDGFTLRVEGDTTA